MRCMEMMTQVFRRRPLLLCSAGVFAKWQWEVQQGGAAGGAPPNGVQGPGSSATAASANANGRAAGAGLAVAAGAAAAAGGGEVEGPGNHSSWRGTRATGRASSLQVRCGVGSASKGGVGQSCCRLRSLLLLPCHALCCGVHPPPLIA